MRNASDCSSLQSCFTGGDAIDIGIEASGDATTLAEWSRVSGGMWKGRNGKWYRIGWGGNGAAGGRNAVLRAANGWKLVGRGFFYFGAAKSLYQGLVVDLPAHSYAGAASSGLDIGMAGVGEFGGPIGLTISAFYFGVGMLPGGWPGVLETQNSLIIRNQEILGPGWSLYGQP